MILRNNQHVSFLLVNVYIVAVSTGNFADFANFIWCNYYW